MSNENEFKFDQENPDVDYLEIINEMKQNSVSKEDYQRLREENRRLLNTIVNGGSLEQAAPQEEAVDIRELATELCNAGEERLSNVEYITKALKLREAIINTGAPDPFLPNGIDVAQTPVDVATAQRVAEAFTSCIEYADGDDAAFTAELQRITRDVRLAPRIK